MSFDGKYLVAVFGKKKIVVDEFTINTIDNKIRGVQTSPSLGPSNFNAVKVNDDTLEWTCSYAGHIGRVPPDGPIIMGFNLTFKGNSIEGQCHSHMENPQWTAWLDAKGIKVPEGTGTGH